jgi:hypothetical protein
MDDILYNGIFSTNTGINKMIKKTILSLCNIIFDSPKDLLFDLNTRYPFLKHTALPLSCVPEYSKQRSLAFGFLCLSCNGKITYFTKNYAIYIDIKGHMMLNNALGTEPPHLPSQPSPFLQPRKPAYPYQSNFNRFAVRKVHSKYAQRDKHIKCTQHTHTHTRNTQHATRNAQDHAPTHQRHAIHNTPTRNAQDHAPTRNTQRARSRTNAPTHQHATRNTQRARSRPCVVIHPG